MPHEEPSAGAPTPRRRSRRWQFGISTLLILTTVVAVVARFAAQPEPWEKFQPRFAEAVGKLGGEVLWKESFHDDPHSPHAISFLYHPGGSLPCFLKDDGLRALRRDFSRLGPFSLDLRNCPVTDAGLLHLAGLSRLECLDLTKTHITDGAVDHLAKIPGLRFVDLSDTAVTGEGIRRLTASLPNLLVWSDEAYPSQQSFVQFSRSSSDVMAGLTLLDGKFLKVEYCCTSDSGVKLTLMAADGSVIWSADCQPLSVDHSKYFHDVNVRSEGDRLIVRSVGSFGTFVELRNLKTGQLLKRWRY
jgi:hypothetical protein